MTHLNKSTRVFSNFPNVYIFKSSETKKFETHLSRAKSAEAL